MSIGTNGLMNFIRQVWRLRIFSEVFHHLSLIVSCILFLVIFENVPRMYSGNGYFRRRRHRLSREVKCLRFLHFHRVDMKSNLSDVEMPTRYV